MARKNRRRETFVPLDLTRTELEVRRPMETETQREERRELLRQNSFERQRRQEEARVNRGIDWSVCVVPGCGRSLIYYGTMEHSVPTERDATLELPICFDHAAVVWRQLVAHQTKNPKFIEAIADVNERLVARSIRQHEEDKVDRLSSQDGDIYFIRLGELIKVGWTRDLWGRLKSYGASAVLLASYPATRTDETNLHRQLSPARAKGREWYEDGPIVAKFIDDALARYGPAPVFEDMWTRPKQTVAGKRAMRYR